MPGYSNPRFNKNPDFFSWRKKQKNKISQRQVFADWLEQSPTIKIVVRLNQCLPMVTLGVALMAGFFAYQGFIKSREDKITEAWKLLLSATGKKINYGQVAAIEKLHHENNASFSYIDLSGTNLRGVSLDHCDFSNANLSGADLSGANLRLCNFENANLSGTDLSKADLTGVDFTNADLRKAKLSDATIDMKLLEAKDFSHADISNARFVFLIDEEDGDGEKWTGFSDTLGEDGDRESWQSRIDTACAEKNKPPDFGFLMDELKAPKCKVQTKTRFIR